MIALHIHNLYFPATIGIHTWEKERQRRFRMQITLSYDASQAIAGDDFRHALDYGKVEQAALDIAASQSWNLIETLAAQLVRQLMRQFPAIQEISVTVEKPQAMDFADYVSATASSKVA
jgi:dihydroneopterin aldolase